MRRTDGAPSRFGHRSEPRTKKNNMCDGPGQIAPWDALDERSGSEDQIVALVQGKQQIVDQCIAVVCRVAGKGIAFARPFRDAIGIVITEIASVRRDGAVILKCKNKFAFEHCCFVDQ